MRDWTGWVRDRLALPTMREGRDRRIVQELADHLEDLHRDALVRGRTLEEADALVEAEVAQQVAARDELLATEPARVRARADRWLDEREQGLRSRGSLASAIADQLQSVRRTLRSLARQPAFAATSVFVLAIGIGATTTMFGLIDTVVLRPLPFAEADRLVSISHHAPAVGLDDAGQSAAWHFTYEEGARHIEHMAMYSGGLASVTGVADPEALPVLYATQHLLATLRVPPLLGRDFAESDMDPDAPPVILLTESYWTSRFGADPTVIGRTLTVDGVARSVVGVAAARVEALGLDADLIIPLRYDLSTLFVGNIGYDAVARISPGSTADDVGEELAQLLPRAWERFPVAGGMGSGEAELYSPLVTPLQERIVGDTANLLWTLFAGALVVLLLSGVNVACLVFVRADGRSTEMAVRAALGASGVSLRREYLRENLALSGLGALVGLGLAIVGTRSLASLAPVVPRGSDTVSVGPMAIGLALLVAVLTGGVYALASSRLSRRGAVQRALRSGGRGSLARGRGAMGLGALASTQLALATTLLVGAGLLFRTLDSLSAVDAGFDDEAPYQLLRVLIPSGEISSPEGAAVALDGIAQQLADLPGVTGVAAATAIPLAGGRNFNSFVAEGIEGADGSVLYRHKWVGGDYFETLGIDLVAGRSLTWDDARTRAPVAVLSERLATAFWGSPQAAIGARVAARSEPRRWHEVVGVARDVRGDGLEQEAPLLVYWPQVTLAFWEGTEVDQVQTWRDMTYAVRTSRAGSPGFVADVEEAVWSIVPNVSVRSIRTMSDARADSMARTTFALMLLGVAAGIALVLGVVGVYGVISYVARTQVREYGLRMALGASSVDVARLVLRRGVAITAAGVLAGVTLSLVVGGVIEGMLFGVRSADPLVMILAPLLLVLVALIASWVPAHRAGRVDPMAVIRSE